MQGCTPRFSAVYSSMFVLFANVIATAADVPPSWIDDAQLHDVQLVGSKFVIAVGDHGAIWKSDDGGHRFTNLSCGFDVSLRSVCFLTDQIGWIAGCDVTANSGIDGGILLSTRDGGNTWQRLGRESLPSLGYVKFFGLEEGIVVGNPTPLAPAGIFKTNDGGHTWRGVQGDAPYGWKAMCFLEPEMGVVAGVNMRVSLMGGEQLFASKLLPQGFRSIRAIKLSPDDVGWLAGDGGLVLKTTSGGVVWESPPTPLPDELRSEMDFRTIEVRGQKVWLGGSPGSVIWHSPDAGQSWLKQVTGQTAPLAALRFSNEQRGVAVGAFGSIVLTEDGGATWKAVHGGDRRAALLSLHTRPGQTNAALLTKLSGELGYRSAVWVAQRIDLGPLAVAPECESVLQSAVQKSGAHAADIHWQLPLTVPGLEYSSDKLVAEWQKQTEGRLTQTLLGGLVRQIRMWRPNIVVLDQPSPDDAASQLLYDGILRAVGQAADASRYPEQAELLGLATWNVDRVYVRLAAGANGDANVDLDEFLPHLKTSTRNAASSSMSLLKFGRVPLLEAVEASRFAYRWIGLDGKPNDDTSGTTREGLKTVSRSRDFFGGLSITPGSAARRDLAPLDEVNLERLQKLIQKQRNFNALTRKSLDDPRIAGQMLGQINSIVDGMEPHQAAIVLRDLADEYRKRSQFEMVEATLVELINRYPQEPESLDAMKWLMQFWCSSETAWQRQQTMTSGTTITRTQIDQTTRFVQQTAGETVFAENGVQQAVGRGGDQVIATANGGGPAKLSAKLDFDPTQSPNKKSGKQGRMKVSGEVDWRTGAVSEWHSRAIELAKQIEKTSPTLLRSPEIQFPLAALRRTKGSPRISDAIMRNFLANAVDVETKQLAERELWTSFATAESPQALAVCRLASERPHLDGLFSEPCWEDAKEIILSEKPSSSASVGASSEGSHTLVMFSYDEEFLFLAFKVPRAAGSPAVPPQMKGRQHDADLSRQDRLSIRLDIDRDYTTWYEFQIDQRGWTAESCWEDRRWDPTWFVAIDADQTDWRVEAAIPWRDLAPTPPRRGSIYGVSILRTIPTVGLQSWIQPATSRPQPSSFGLLKFD